MPLESITEILTDSSRPTFLIGSTPPREGTSPEAARDAAKKFAERSAVLAADGFIVYDIKDEEGRTTAERPFPFRKTIDSSQYASYFPPASGKQCVVYKCVSDINTQEYESWLNESTREFGHIAFNLVGAASSQTSNSGISLAQAANMLRERSPEGIHFGCVAIAERHTLKGNEANNMLRKIDLGAEWFITQGVFASVPVIKMIVDYGDLCRKKGITPKKVVLTFAPCGRPKTMQFVKWLGMFVPEEAEQRIFASANPVKESIILLKELLIDILEKTAGSGVPLGVNVESLSIFKEEIDAAHELFQILQATLLNHRGSPWSVRWFDLRKSLELTATIAPPRVLKQLNQFYVTVEGLPKVPSLEALQYASSDEQQDKKEVNSTKDSEPGTRRGAISIFPTIALMVVSSLIGFLIGKGRYLRS